ncbi:hypothetical protein Tco_0635466 [Tanacetum coccineum]
MQMQESKIDMGKAVDVDLVITESKGTESEVQDDNNSPGNDTDAEDADIRPIYDEESMAEVQLTVECNIFAIGQQHYCSQPKIIYEVGCPVILELCHVKSLMLDSSPDNQTTNYSKQSLESENILLKKIVAQFQKDFSRMEAHCIALELKYQNQALKSRQHGQILNKTSNKTKIKKEIDVLEIMNIELEHSVAKLPQIQEKVFAISALKNDLRRLRGNSVDTKFAKTSVLGKPVLQSLRKQSVVRQRIAFIICEGLNFKQQLPSQVDCVFNANHDACITKLLKEVNSRAKIQSHKTRNSNKPVDQKSHTQKPGRQIFTGHRFSPNKTSAVYEKTSPRSDLRWKPTGRIFKSVGLRWIPTGKLFDSCTSKVDSEPPHGSNVDIPNIHESKQTLDLSAGTSINVQKEQSLDLSAELESLFGHLFDEYFNGVNQVVSKSSDITHADASVKRQEQPDSTSSTSTLATIVTADENFDL